MGDYSLADFLVCQRALYKCWNNRCVMANAWLWWAFEIYLSRTVVYLAYKAEPLFLMDRVCNVNVFVNMLIVLDVYRYYQANIECWNQYAMLVGCEVRLWYFVQRN